jgi:hypothetical protein
MKKRFVFGALAVALLLTPVVLTIGTLVLIPLLILLVPVALLAGLAALPALFVAATRDVEAGARAPAAQATRHVSGSAAYSG